MRYKGGKTKVINQILPKLTGRGISGIVDLCCGSAIVGRRHPAMFKHLNDLNPDTVGLLTTLKLQPEEIVSGVTNLVAAIGAGLTINDLSDRIRCGMSEPGSMPSYLYWIVCRFSFRGGGDRWFSGFSKEGWDKLSNLSDHQITDAVTEDRQGLGGDMVTISSLPAEDLISIYGSTTVLLYLDLPYLGRGSRDNRHANGETRNQYAFDVLTEEEHAGYLNALAKNERSPIAVSHFEHPLYDEILSDWFRFKYPTNSVDGQTISDCLYVNPKLNKLNLGVATQRYRELELNLF